MKNHKHMPQIDCPTYLTRTNELYDEWGEASNATEDQEELFQLAEQFILDFKDLLTQAGGHPSGQRPRVRS